ncbi:hypothetical protein Poli38472_010282 [Pythium oligandrum]|uniref:Uncharacterized protein n=1 Tax=Pythium oligandrum TaxID=41045 RepID=A0A8K1FHF2_PYTOL|nr:hypothetical protein Poli38472_010282 [Pythium oligandrum]|eukprot:TMW58723.1 hypothetical protein Poli38472_010282 [Pythium oligandrum]
MTTETKQRRRARRSLPSAIERNLSLQELINEDTCNDRRKRSQEAALAQVSQLNAYFAMIDQTELVVESAPVVETKPTEEKEHGVLSDSELTRPTKKRARNSTTERPKRQRKEKELKDKYQEYYEGNTAPVSINEFEATVEPVVKTSKKRAVRGSRVPKEPQTELL